ncbi:MAG TPA: hypothetical protein VIJ14_03460 [Rhabdochlamydiaceae bacterium]
MLTELNKLLLSMNSALIGAVAPSLRSVSIELDHEMEQVIFWFYYDGEITDELFDLASVAGTEASTCMTRYTSEDQIIRLDYPKPIPFRGKLAYHRKETTYNHLVSNGSLEKIIAKESSYRVYTLLSAQRALLGIVVPELRAVAVITPENKSLPITVSFFYDGEVSPDLLNGTQEMIRRMRDDLFDGFQIKERVMRLDFPTRITLQAGDELVYQRHEPT